MIAWQILAAAAILTGTNDAVLLDFYSDTCPPCRMMDPIVQELQARGYPIQKVNVAQQPQLAAQYGVTGVPCFVMVCQGREIDRQVGATSADRLKQMVARAGSMLSGSSATQSPAGGPVALGQSPDVVPAAIPLPSTSASDPFQGAGGSAGMSPSPANAGAAGVSLEVKAPQALAIGGPAPAVLPGPEPAPQGGATPLEQQLVRSTVRLTVEDAQGHSYGSGTVVDVRGDAALVLTCGHIFRESQGKGRIKVLVQEPTGPREVDGQLHSYSIDPDLGLVIVRPVSGLEKAQLGDSATTTKPGDAVYTAGCDHGRAASVATSRVTALDKYLGSPNVEVAGEPVQGRSGGGLFDRQGRLIGVCNAADPTEREGMYAALTAIQQMFDKHGLSSLYRGGQTPAAPASSIATADGSGDARSLNHGASGASKAEGQAGAGPAGLASADEADALQRIAQDNAAEVICIIRPTANPRAKSEIVVLDRASPAFLNQLASERTRQDARHLTSLTLPTRRAERAVQPAAPEVSSDGWRRHVPR